MSEQKTSQLMLPAPTQSFSWLDLEPHQIIKLFKTGQARWTDMPHDQRYNKVKYALVDYLWLANFTPDEMAVALGINLRTVHRIRKRILEAREEEVRTMPASHVIGEYDQEVRLAKARILKVYRESNDSETKRRCAVDIFNVAQAHIKQMQKLGCVPTVPQRHEIIRTDDMPASVDILEAELQKLEEVAAKNGLESGVKSIRLIAGMEFTQAKKEELTRGTEDEEN